MTSVPSDFTAIRCRKAMFGCTSCHSSTITTAEAVDTKESAERHQENRKTIQKKVPWICPDISSSIVSFSVFFTPYIPLQSHHDMFEQPGGPGWPRVDHGCPPGLLRGGASPAASAARPHLAEDVQHAAGVGGAALLLLTQEKRGHFFGMGK